MQYPMLHIATGKPNTAVWELQVLSGLKSWKERIGVCKIFADLSLEHRIIRDISEKRLQSQRSGELVDYVLSKPSNGLSAIGISISVYRYQPDPSRDNAVILKLRKVVGRYPAGAAVSSSKFCVEVGSLELQASLSAVLQARPEQTGDVVRSACPHVMLSLWRCMLQRSLLVDGLYKR